MGLFISCEGLPFTGKTTISKIIYQYYKVKGYNVVFVDDVLDTEIGRILKLYMLNFNDFRKAIFYLSCANTIFQQNNINNILKNSDILILENYLTFQLLSTLNSKKEMDILKIFKKTIKLPDLLIFFRARLEDMKKREKSSLTDPVLPLENESELQSINNKLISKIDTLNLKRVIVDTSKNSEEECAKEIIDKINSLLK